MRPNGLNAKTSSFDSTQGQRPQFHIAKDMRLAFTRTFEGCKRPKSVHATTLIYLINLLKGVNSNQQWYCCSPCTFGGVSVGVPFLTKTVLYPLRMFAKRAAIAVGKGLVSKSPGQAASTEALRHLRGRARLLMTTPAKYTGMRIYHKASGLESLIARFNVPYPGKVLPVSRNSGIINISLYCQHPGYLI